MLFNAGDCRLHTVESYYFMLDMVKNFLELGADYRQVSFNFLEEDSKKSLRLDFFKRLDLIFCCWNQIQKFSIGKIFMSVPSWLF